MTANVTPTWTPTQNHEAKRAPASRPAPIAAMIANQAMPRTGLGMPNASACGVVITDPQESTGLTLQNGI